MLALEEMEALPPQELQAAEAILTRMVLEVPDLEMGASVVSFLRVVELGAEAVVTTAEVGELLYFPTQALVEPGAQDILIQM